LSRIYNFIYGSQIKLLQKLNSGGQFPKEKIKYFYDAAKDIWPDLYNNYSFEQYMNFLSSAGLVVISSNGVVTLTSLGQDFLRFLIEDNRPTDKAF
jgi:hypothetical protein